MTKKLNSRPGERRSARVNPAQPRAAHRSHGVTREDVAEAMRQTLAAAERRLQR